MDFLQLSVATLLLCEVNGQHQCLNWDTEGGILLVKLSSDGLEFCGWAVEDAQDSSQFVALHDVWHMQGRVEAVDDFKLFEHLLHGRRSNNEELSVLIGWLLLKEDNKVLEDLI